MTDAPVAKVHMAMANLRQACDMMQAFEIRTCYPSLRRVLDTADKQIQDAIIAMDLENADAKHDD